MTGREDGEYEEVKAGAVAAEDVFKGRERKGARGKGGRGERQCGDRAE